MSRPRQALVLSEDRGDDLGPPWTARPRAMLQFHGRPFLAYVIELLREQGFIEVVLMLSDEPAAVRDYFGDGRAVGLRVTYSVASPADQTVERFHAVRPLAQERFLLVRGETYWPMLFDRFWAQYAAAAGPALIAVYANKDGYAADDVRVHEDGVVGIYDPSGAAPGLKGTDIGWAILDSDVFDLLPHHGMRLEEALYPVLARRKRLVAHVTEHRFYGVTSRDRLIVTDAFLARRPAVFVALDGVLGRRRLPSGRQRVAAGFEWMPGALDALRRFRSAGYTVIVLSSQASVPPGQVITESLEGIHTAMRAQALAAGGGIDAIYHCPHDVNAGCECRKPRPGLLFRAQHDFSLDLTRASLIGAEAADIACAEAAGAHGFLVTEQEPLIVHARRLVQATGRSTFSTP